MNPFTLPKGFTWQLTAQPSKEYARLIYQEQETAVIRRLGRGWIAVISDGFSCHNFHACAVPDLVKGQMWLAIWARHRASFIHSVCLSKRSEMAPPGETYQPGWLAQGFMPLCSPF